MSRIAESELIINPRGAIYHLALRPEEVAGTVITVGDPDRVKEISKHFDSVEVKRQHREFISHTGYVGKKRLTVLSSGIGPDNIDIVLNELDALINIDFATREIKKDLKSLNIIRIGTSGSLQEDIPVDSFVASTHGLGVDNLLNFYRHEQNDQEKELLQSFVTHTQIHGQIGNPYISSGAASLIKHFVKEDPAPRTVDRIKPVEASVLGAHRNHVGGNRRSRDDFRTELDLPELAAILRRIRPYLAVQGPDDNHVRAGRRPARPGNLLHLG